MPYGPWEHPRRLVPHVILSALTNQEVRMTQGVQQRDFVYVDDVVEALMIAAAASVPPGSVFNIGSGTGTPVGEAARTILRLMGDPVSLCLGAIPTRPDEIMEMSADITSAREQLGWQPRTSLEDGLSKTVTWFEENLELVKQYS
jgi:UDP-glucose 4-epimerase